MHFSEEKANNYTPASQFSSPPLTLDSSQSAHTALTPWIALVSCDKNATDASMEIDIFTLARDKGAVAAVRIPPSYLP